MIAAVSETTKAEAGVSIESFLQKPVDADADAPIYSGPRADPC